MKLQCPNWFKYVSCVIVYNSKGQVLLGKRRQGELEGGKWAILGGTGAFGRSKNREDFARMELLYDARLDFKPEALKAFTVILFDNSKSAKEDYFAYKCDGEIEATRYKKAPEEIKWFSMEEIDCLTKENLIAFDNYETLKKFEAKFLNKT